MYSGFSKLIIYSYSTCMLNYSMIINSNIQSIYIHQFLVLGISVGPCGAFYKEFVDHPWIPQMDIELRDLGIQTWEDSGFHRRETREIKTFADMKKAPVTTSEDFLENILREHNRLRRLHGVPALKQDVELSKTAQYWANYLGQTSEGRTLPLLFRKGWHEIGGSIWAAVGRKDANHISPTFAWYNEERWYTYGKKYCKLDPPIDDHHTDHFTQMIWRETTQIGCAKAKNKSKHIYVVCHYSPPGNVRGTYEENVPVPKRAE